MKEEDKVLQSAPPAIGSDRIFDDFCRWGYLQASLDPLGDYLRPQPVPELEVTGEIADQARQIYCGTVGWSSSISAIPSSASGCSSDSSVMCARG